MNYDSYFGNLFAGTSQWFHVICGGDRDVSISGMLWKTRRNNWKRKYVDFSFQLIDGKDHCEKAWKADHEESYHKRQAQEWLVTIFVFLFCTLINIFINPLLWIWKKLK